MARGPVLYHLAMWGGTLEETVIGASPMRDSLFKYLPEGPAAKNKQMHVLGMPHVQPVANQADISRGSSHEE